ncbi:SUMF1/EgtB/PvdO family nonheme iron enzyme [Bradyrhizobium brasilense]|uniref:SUMF1/EgtB/PvdO family nonheme iron enzyme n=1 Tax=Bradyrhizobium brasilense TaxID=1419277 RepID=UPI0035C6EDC5
MSQETNGYGLHNVAGNVWEWYEDRLAPSGVPLNREPAPNRSTRGESCLGSCGSRRRFAARPERVGRLVEQDRLFCRAHRPAAGSGVG